MTKIILEEIISSMIITQQDNAKKFTEFHNIIKNEYHILSYTDYIQLGNHAYKNGGNKAELRNITSTCFMLAYMKINDEPVNDQAKDKYSEYLFDFLYRAFGERIKAQQFHTKELAEVEFQITLDSYFSKSAKYLLGLGNFYGHFAYHTGSSFYLKRAINFFNIAINTTNDSDQQVIYQIGKFELLVNCLSNQGSDPHLKRLSNAAMTLIHDATLDAQQKSFKLRMLCRDPRIVAMQNTPFEKSIIDFSEMSEAYSIQSIMWINSLKEINLKDSVSNVDDKSKIVHEQLLINYEFMNQLTDLEDESLIAIAPNIPMTISFKHGAEIQTIATSIALSQFYLTFQTILKMCALTNMAKLNNQFSVNPNYLFNNAIFINSNFLRTAISNFCSVQQIDINSLELLKKIVSLVAIRLTSIYKNAITSAKNISEYKDGEQNIPNAISLASVAAAIALYFLSSKDIQSLSPDYLADEIVDEITNANFQNSQDNFINLHIHFFVTQKPFNCSSTAQISSSLQQIPVPQQSNQLQLYGTAMSIDPPDQTSSNTNEHFQTSTVGSSNTTTTSTSLIVPRTPFLSNNNNNVQQNLTLFASFPPGNTREQSIIQVPQSLPNQKKS